MRKLRVPSLMAALLLLAAYWLCSREPAHERELLRAEPLVKQLPPSRSAPARIAHSPAAIVPTPQVAEGEEPREVWLRIESSAGEPVEWASVTLRTLGDELREPVDLSSASSDAQGFAAIDIDPFAELAPEDEAELLIEASDHTSKRVAEAELMTALGSDEPYVVVLDTLQEASLLMRCPEESGASVYLGWYTDDGSDVQRFASDCEDGVFQLESVQLPRVPLHFVAFVADPAAPQLGLRSYHASGSQAVPRIEMPLAPYGIEFRSVQLVDAQGSAISEALVEPALHTSPGALLDRWLNPELLTTDAEGLFPWVSAGGRSSRLAVTPPGFPERSELELRSGRDSLRIDMVDMVRCHFLGVAGESVSYAGFTLSALSDDGPYAWQTDAGDYAYTGQANFAWPEGAHSVAVQAAGFFAVELTSPRAPCVLTARPDYDPRRRGRIRR